MRKLFTLILLLGATISWSQDDRDSLLNVVNSAPDDTNKVKTYLMLYDLSKHTAPDEALEYATKIRELSQSLDYTKGFLLSYNLVGNIHYRNGKYDKALSEYLELAEKADEHGDIMKKRSVMNNIGAVYLIQKDYESANKYFRKYTNMALEMKDTVSAIRVTNSIGETYRRAKKLDSALICFNKVLEFGRKTEDSRLVSISLNNIGNVWHNREQFEKAIGYYEEALEIKKNTSRPASLAIAHNNLAETYARINNLKMAESYYREGLKLAESVDHLDAMKTAHHGLSEIYESRGQKALAFDHFKEYATIKDSLLNEAKQEVIYEMEAKYDNLTLKKEKAEVERDRMEKIARLNQTRKERLEARRESERNLYLAGGIAMLLAFAGILALIYRKKTIQKQKDNALLQHKNEEIAEKSKEITDSILYAQRLQEAILPPRRSFSENLQLTDTSDQFLLYMPKDIVAGDFYWLETYTPPSSSSVEGDKGGNVHQCIYFAAADCTGHGVPGAMVSVVCSNALNKAIVEEQISDPGEVLNRTRDLVAQRFGRSDKKVYDGMDIALVKVDMNNAPSVINEASSNSSITIEFAGANNPLWIFRKKDGAFESLKPDRQPIGKHVHDLPFNTQRTTLFKGDTIYLFSDGYSDQFGGAKGKKMKLSNFRKFLESILHLPMEDQRDSLIHHFQDWRGDIEQIDDVCVIGVRI